jgi:hypothetical protein
MLKSLKEMQDRQIWQSWYRIALRNGATKTEADAVADLMLKRSRTR